MTVIDFFSKNFFEFLIQILERHAHTSSFTLTQLVWLFLPSLSQRVAEIRMTFTFYTLFAFVFHDFLSCFPKLPKSFLLFKGESFQWFFLFNNSTIGLVLFSGMSHLWCIPVYISHIAVFCAWETWLLMKVKLWISIAFCECV